jgi:hypothetical protein
LLLLSLFKQWLSPLSGHTHKGELKDGEDEPPHLGSLGGYILGEYTLMGNDGRIEIFFKNMSLQEHHNTRGVYSKRNIPLRGKTRNSKRFGKDIQAFS